MFIKTASKTPALTFVYWSCLCTQTVHTDFSVNLAQNGIGKYNPRITTERFSDGNCSLRARQLYQLEIQVFPAMFTLRYNFYFIILNEMHGCNFKLACTQPPLNFTLTLLEKNFENN